MVNPTDQIFNFAGSELSICVGKWTFIGRSRIFGFEPFTGGILGFKDFHG